MSEINSPYWSTRKDMSEMNMPYGTPLNDMSEMNNMPSDNIQANDMAEKQSEPCPKMVLAMAYVPKQIWETPYEVTEGTHRGTLFPELYKPFLGGGNKP